jgi:fucose 4-O-acetylase-like acetyltransferase
MAEVCAESPTRELSADLYRVLAVLLVVIGHWLLAAVTYRGGRFGFDEVLAVMPWTQWLTWAFQVVPVFFVVAGYANASSWTRWHEARADDRSVWLRHRIAGVVGPTTAYVAVALAAVAIGFCLGVPGARLAMPMWVVALHLWFLPVYLGVVSLTPLAVAAQRHWGLKVPATMAAAVAIVDAITLVGHVPFLGMVNYALCWGAIYQVGVAWHDGAFTRRRPVALVLGAAIVLASVIWSGCYPVSMIGVTGQVVQNTSPPTVALLALAGVQAGVLLAAAPTVTAWLRRVRWRPALVVANQNALALYLWHMVPVVVLALVCYPTAIMPQPDLGTAEWWWWRLGWIGSLSAVTAVELGMLRLGRSVLARPTPVFGVRLPPQWSEPLLVVGTAAVGYALWRFAAQGFAPAGHLSPGTVAAYLAGLVLIALHPTGGGTSGTRRPLLVASAWVSMSNRTAHRNPVGTLPRPR